MHVVRERIWIESRTTQSNALTTANQSFRKFSKEPMRARSKKERENASDQGAVGLVLNLIGWQGGASFDPELLSMLE